MRTTSFRIALALAAAPLAASGALAQSPTQQPPPQVIASAQGEVKVTPDRATLMVAVETRGTTAAAAAAENARIQRAVLEALRTRVGLGNDQLSTAGYNVSPEYDYSTTAARRTPRVVGYVARNSVRAEIRKIEQVGTAIDATLAAGANNIEGVTFWSSTYDDARRQALGEAIAKACQDANAMARAAGMNLGTPLELSSQAMHRPMMMQQDMAMGRAASAPANMPTPIEPGEMTVAVVAMGRWSLSSGTAPASPCGSAGTNR